MMRGYIDAILYIIFIAFSTIWIDHLGDQYNGLLLLGCSSLVAAIFFNAVSYKNFINIHKIILKDPANWLLLSITVVICWWLTYDATINSSARSFISILFITSATCSSLYTKKYIKLTLCLLSLGLISMIMPELNIKSFTESVIAGICFFYYFKISSKFCARHGLNVTEILAIRFYILIIVAFSVYFYQNHELFLSEPSYQWYIVSAIPIFILLGIANMVVPNYFAQSSSNRIGAPAFSTICSFVPVLTFLLQGFVLHDWSMGVFMTCLFLSFVLNGFPKNLKSIRKI